MEGPPLGSGGEDITWPDQVAPWGRKASSTRKIRPQTSNLWQERPGSSLLFSVIASCGDPERVLGITPTQPRDGVHTFLETQEVTALTGVHLVRLPPAPPDDPRGPRALSPAPDWELLRDAWAAWLPRLPSQC